MIIRPYISIALFVTFAFFAANNPNPNFFLLCAFCALCG